MAIFRQYIDARMKLLGFLRCALFSIALLITLLSSVSGQTLNCRLVRVIDGDTYELMTQVGKELTVRLDGIDAPERAQPYGREATETARAYLQEKDLRLDIEGKDRYGRTIGTVYVGETSLGELLVGNGYAWWYERYAPDKTNLKLLQRQARDASRGLWAQEAPIAPWEWRRNKNRRKQASGPDRDCSDFKTQAEAQEFFDQFEGDPHRLDANGDGVPCEGLD